MKFVSITFFGFILLIVILYMLVISRLFSPIYSIGDFRAQYAGARIAHAGKISNLYDIDVQHAAQKSFLPTLPKNLLLPFYSPPVVALLLAPIGGLPFNQAYLLFCSVQLVLFLLSLFLLFRSTSLPKTQILLLSTAYTTIWMGILHGQLSSLWMFSIALFWYLYQNNREFAAGLAISLLFLKLYLIIVPLIFFIVFRQWRIIGGIVTGIFVIAAVTLLIVGVDGVRHYVEFAGPMMQLERIHGVSKSHQSTLYGFLAFLTIGEYGVKAFVVPPIVLPLWIVGGGTVILVSVRKWLRVARSFRATREVLFLHLMALTLFLSPHTHNYDLSIFFIPLVIYLDHKARTKDTHILREDPIKSRYIQLAILVGTIFASTGVGLFAPLGIIVYGYIFILLEKEYDKLSQVKNEKI